MNNDSLLYVGNFKREMQEYYNKLLAQSCLEKLVSLSPQTITTQVFTNVPEECSPIVVFNNPSPECRYCKTNKSVCYDSNWRVWKCSACGEVTGGLIGGGSETEKDQTLDSILSMNLQSKEERKAYWDLYLKGSKIRKRFQVPEILLRMEAVSKIKDDSERKRISNLLQKTISFNSLSLSCKRKYNKVFPESSEYGGEKDQEEKTIQIKPKEKIKTLFPEIDFVKQLTRNMTMDRFGRTIIPKISNREYELFLKSAKDNHVDIDHLLSILRENDLILGSDISTQRIYNEILNFHKNTNSISNLRIEDSKSNESYSNEDEETIITKVRKSFNKGVKNPNYHPKCRSYLKATKHNPVCKRCMIMYKEWNRLIKEMKSRKEYYREILNNFKDSMNNLCNECEMGELNFIEKHRIFKCDYCNRILNTDLTQYENKNYFNKESNNNINNENLFEMIFQV
jgi:ribosomal protein L37AE/L43A